jgi:putative PIN family toxin of toxin-antitoxin system
MRYHGLVVRVVLDTDVVIAALRSESGASRVLLTGALQGDFSLLVSVPLMLEYEAVATRPAHLAASGLSERDVHVLLDALATVIVPVRLAFLWRPVLPDAADDMVLETAANGRADLLVTLNRRDFEPAREAFAFEVVSPREALTRLRRRL